VRINLRHPQDGAVVAAVGFDHACGWFGTVRRSGRLVASLDALEGHKADLQAVITLLTDYGFFSEEDVAEALSLLPHKEWDELEHPSTREAGRVIELLKQAAGE